MDISDRKRIKWLVTFLKPTIAGLDDFHHAVANTSL